MRRPAITSRRSARRRSAARGARSLFWPMARWSMSPRLLPLDLETIVGSVRKTGRCVVVHEATLTSGFGAELAALVQETCFYHLEAPVARVTGWDTPYPHAQEWDYFPGPARVGRALLEILQA